MSFAKVFISIVNIVALEVFLPSQGVKAVSSGILETFRFAGVERM